MYTRELLLAAGILLLVFLGRREHLAFTDTIKDLRGTVTTEERDRIFALAPTSFQQKATAATYQGLTAKDYPIAIIQDFQTKIYIPATEPITEDVVNNYIAQTTTELQAAPNAAPLYLEVFRNGDAKRLVMAYVGLPMTNDIPISNMPTSSTSASIPQVIGQLRDNLLEYKMTGQSQYKQIYEGNKAWLDQYIASLSSQLTREADAINADVTSYRTANSDMVQTQADFQRVKTEGPQAEDRYLTIKKQMDNVPVADMTGLYVKGGIAAGLVLGIVALSFF
jgi:hypothetical protein